MVYGRGCKVIYAMLNRLSLKELAVELYVSPIDKDL
jgi:hypothetical protein